MSKQEVVLNRAGRRNKVYRIKLFRRDKLRRRGQGTKNRKK